MSVAVTFDFGETLASLDYDFLRARLAERGAELDASRAQAARTKAWQLYGERKADGHAPAWQAMIGTLLHAGGVEAARVDELAEWLWDEQPAANLWRRPVPGMIELVQELRARGRRVGIISNSEGRLQELVAELGWIEHFEVIADSGRLGIDKPHREIFEWTCVELGTPPDALIHIGDSWAADVEGALAFGARAIWFWPSPEERELSSAVQGARDAGELRSALERFGVFTGC
jgi:putative hydrolase of the HAD superfamily